MLVLFGVIMRVVLLPLNQKAMRAQMKNMAVQPLLQEIQTKYKDNPEKLQKEMMKLYKEQGFNPAGGVSAHAASLAGAHCPLLRLPEHH